MKPAQMANQLRKSLEGVQAYAGALSPPSMLSPTSQYSSICESQAMSPEPSVRTPSVRSQPVHYQNSLTPPQSHVSACDAKTTSTECEPQRSLGLGFITSSEEQHPVAFEKPVRRTSARSHHSRVLSMVEQYRDSEKSSATMEEKASVSRTNVEPTCHESSPGLSSMESREGEDDENNALDMLITALEEEYQSDMPTSLNQQERPIETAPTNTDQLVGPSAPNPVPSATQVPDMESTVMSTSNKCAPDDSIQKSSVSKSPAQLRVWPELSHQLPPVEQEAPLTHGDIRRIYAEMLAEQEAAKRAKKPIGKVLRRMRTLLDPSSAPSQPLSKARAQAEPYPASRKTEIKPDYYSVADKEMLRIALYSSHNQVPDSKMPTPSPLSSNNENTPLVDSSTPVVRSLRSARRLEPSTRPRPNVTSLRERNNLPRAMQMTTPALR